MPGHYAVVIGINYRNFPATMDHEAQSHAGISALNYAEADAEEMAALLEADGYEVLPLVGLAARRAAIIDALDEQSRKAGAEGLLLVHYSGHGALHQYNRELAYLLPVDADPGKLPSTAIPLNSIAQYHLELAHSALVLLDCCHSGYAVGFKGEDKDVVLTNEAQMFSQRAAATFTQMHRRVILAACGGQQFAREREDFKHGVLTYYVLEHWRNSSETVDDYSISRYLAQHMPRLGVPAPVRGGPPHQGLIELRPARTNSDHTLPTQISEPEANIHVQRGNDHYKNHFYEQALTEYNHAIRLNPNLAEAYVGRGYVYDKQGNYKRALAEFDQAIELDPKFAEAYSGRGTVYFGQNNYKRALAEFDQAIELNPNLASAYNGRGGVYLEQNTYELALDEYNQAIVLDPYLAEAYAGRGHVYYRQDKHEQALAEFDQAIELDPECSAAQRGRTIVYARLGQPFA